MTNNLDKYVILASNIEIFRYVNGYTLLSIDHVSDDNRKTEYELNDIGYEIISKINGRKTFRNLIECFLQALFGQNCKIFLDIVASPFWTKLQSTG